MYSKKFISIKIALAFIIFIFSSGFSVIGHRGDPVKAPEETFQSFDTAFNEGADYVELDLHVSKDNVLVISHDRNLERITGVPAIVSQQNFSYLSSLHQKNGEPVHSLDELFAHYKDNPNAKFLLETKKTKKGSPKNMEELMQASIEKYHMQDRIMFHSFSAESLKKLSELMPSVPRIFIAGTIKRVNFDVLSYVTGVNLSSNIVTPDIINDMHYMHKSIYVWDEMNESPSKWNTLVNMPIDGVVTNFPATGNEYRNLKNESKETNYDQNTYYFGLKELPIYENPYKLIKTKKHVNPLDGYHVTNIINFQGKRYVQLGENAFANADGFNSDAELAQLRPYFGASVIYRGQQPDNFIYRDPQDSDSIIGRMPTNKSEKIENIQKFGSETWLKVNEGWINAKYVLIQLNPDPTFGNNSKKSYLDLPSNQRFQNVDLLQNFYYIKRNNKEKFIHTDLFNQFNHLPFVRNSKSDNNSMNKI
ncbi:glycerophosphodiester phosphodiesterase [Companilactobacillus ginsenosidimutans]|uniref:Cell surface protein n=1 Tax=Companilactobacillus ginsenosidimutans TaxID=1007676 RepID=A0A0H4QG50_9LACO|nr:glycerophosphodiester phosphodiesterase [Companilactobacillus ginsenosidimutans]AKP66902.1 cell surface protein [Companilactobacillus ginsenosidimutans]